MIYKFKSKATGDVIMLGASADQLLRIIGKEPAARGIVQPEAMPSAMRAIEQAVELDDAARKQAAADAAAEGKHPAVREAVSLRQRAWPLLEMMQRAYREGQDIVWGV